MYRNLKFGIVIAALVAIVSISAFLYLTRGVAAPTESVQASAQELTSDVSTNQTVYRISQDESTVSYTIEEVLNGVDTTVVGTTTEVAGDILVNTSDLSQSEIGEIRINARTFATDEDRRDNAVARFVLQSESDANEYIIFQPTSISALPDTAAVGDELALQVTGDLTIAGVTQSVTFDVTASLTSADQLVGHAEFTVALTDFNLTIPDVPFVASVEETVLLQLDFVANAVDASAITS
ncbi:MAG: YceI family protein [Chloroflexi bacterium]|nr:YceI family protein [Chloroflexota bacterium]MCC6893235.1 YceI family protein [Anaerolineae bacterium]